MGWDEQFSEKLWTKYITTRGSKPQRGLAAQLKRAQTWADQGYNVDLILQAAIENGWRGLFIPKDMAEPVKKRDLKNEHKVGLLLESLQKVAATQPVIIEQPVKKLEKDPFAFDNLSPTAKQAREDMKRILGV